MNAATLSNKRRQVRQLVEQFELPVQIPPAPPLKQVDFPLGSMRPKPPSKILPLSRSQIRDLRAANEKS